MTAPMPTPDLDPTLAARLVAEARASKFYRVRVNAICDQLDAALAEVERLRSVEFNLEGVRNAAYGWQTDCHKGESERDTVIADRDAYRKAKQENDERFMTERDEARQDRARYHAALTKISAIRDSIVGMQGFNFSEHAYPLVAALNEAGFEGAGYTIARENLGTLIEQRDRAEAERDEARREVERLREERDRYHTVADAQSKLLAELPPSAEQLIMAEMDAAVARTKCEVAESQRDRLAAEVERMTYALQQQEQVAVDSNAALLKAAHARDYYKHFLERIMNSANGEWRALAREALQEPDRG